MKLKNEKFVGLYLDKQLYDYLKKESEKNRTSVSYEIRKLILKEYNKTND